MRDALSPQLVSRMFDARSIVMVGASNDVSRIGGRPLRFLREFGYGGRVTAVNPNHQTVQGVPSYPSVSMIPHEIDLALIALPAHLVLNSVNDCIAAGVRSIIVYSSGLGEVSKEGNAIEERIADAAEKHEVGLLGPNCLGALDINLALPLTFSAVLERGLPAQGSLGIVSQSGAVGMTLLTACGERGVGISRWLSTGNEASLSVADGIAALADDPNTEVIACYLESVRRGTSLRECFALAARAGKPVVVLRGGRSSEGANAAASHTGALAGNGRAFDAVCEETGVVQVSTLTEQLHAIYTLQGGVRRSGSIAVVSLSGGIGVLAADIANEDGVPLRETSAELQRQLSELIPLGYVRNPIDVTGAVINTPSLLADTIAAIAGEKTYSTLVYCFAHNGLDASLLGAYFDPMREAVAKSVNVNHIFAGLTTSDSRALLERERMLVFDDPADAVRAAALLSAPPSLTVETGGERGEPPSDAWHLGDPPWNEVEAKELVRRFGVSTPDEAIVHSSAAAAAAAAVFGVPVAVKVISREATHKAEIGAVRLNVMPGDASRAYDEVSASADVAGCAIEGALITPMHGGSGLETILGIYRDSSFGPMLVFGLGGKMAEALDEVSLATPPLDMSTARRWLEGTRSFRIMERAQGHFGLDVDALVACVVGFSRCATVSGPWSAIEVNPLMVGRPGEGVLALDASIVEAETDTSSRGRSGQQLRPSANVLR